MQRSRCKDLERRTPVNSQCNQHIVRGSQGEGLKKLKEESNFFLTTFFGWTNNDCHILYSNHISPRCKIIWIVSIWKPLAMAITSGPSYQMVLESAFMKSSWSIFLPNLRKKVFDIGNHIFFPNKICHQWKTEFCNSENANYDFSLTMSKILSLPPWRSCKRQVLKFW